MAQILNIIQWQLASVITFPPTIVFCDPLCIVNFDNG